MWKTVTLYWLRCHPLETAQLSSPVVVSLKICISLVPSHLTTKILSVLLDWCNEKVAWVPREQTHSRLWILISGLKSVVAKATTVTMVPKPLHYTCPNIVALYPGHTTTGPRVFKEHRSHRTKCLTYLRVNQSFSELLVDQNIGLKWGLHKSQTAGEPGLPIPPRFKLTTMKRIADYSHSFTQTSSCIHYW